VVKKEISVTEYFDIFRAQDSIQLSAYPVTSITSIHNSQEEIWDAGTLIDSDYYHVDLDSGLVHFDSYILLYGAKAVRVVYVGGMADTTDNFVTAYPHIASAITMEVAYRFQRRHTIGLIAVTAAGGSTTIAQKTQFLPAVEDVLDSERRY